MGGIGEKSLNVVHLMLKMLVLSFYLKKKVGSERTILVDPVAFEATSHLNMVGSN